MSSGLLLDEICPWRLGQSHIDQYSCYILIVPWECMLWSVSIYLLVWSYQWLIFYPDSMLIGLPAVPLVTSIVPGT